MDWKAWYRAEAESEIGREAVRAALARHPEGDPAVRLALREGGVASFPHTTLCGSAEPLARVVTSIRAERAARVVALGVLHLSALPEPEAEAARELLRGDATAFGAIGGAFLDAGPAVTPFGALRPGPAPSEGRWVRAAPRLLANEFSLDLFLGVLAAACAGEGAAPAVTRLYVGATRGGDGRAADDVAAAVRPLLGPGTAFVTTGDLVHAGNGYSTPAEVAALPRGTERLRDHFAARVDAMLRATFADPPRLAEAEEIAREVRSDQRHVAPVLASLLGPGASTKLHAFELTDYGGILGHPPPCVVASALVTVSPARVQRGQPRGR